MEADGVKTMFAEYYKLSKMCAEEVIGRLKDEDQKSCLDKLHDAVREVVAYENKTRKESQALLAIERDITEKEELEQLGDLSEMLNEKLKNSTVVWTENLQKYESQVASIFNSLELKDMIVASSDSNIDPYTKKPIEHAVRTKSCNHVFDRTYVTEVLAKRGKRGKLRCPYVGCNQHFTAEDLVDINQESEQQ